MEFVKRKTIRVTDTCMTKIVGFLHVLVSVSIYMSRWVQLRTCYV